MVKKSLFAALALVWLVAAAGCTGELKKENADLKAKLDKLTADQAALVQQHDAARVELEDLRAKTDTLTAENNALKKELDVLKARAAAKPAPKKAVKSPAKKKKTTTKR